MMKTSEKLKARALQAAAMSGVVALCLGTAGAQMNSNQQPGAMQPGSMQNGQPTAGPGQMPMQGIGNQDGMMHRNTEGDMADQMFLRKAAEGGMAEVQLGQLASTNGDSQAVKDFGQQMATDHAKLDNTMAPIAQTMGVPAPSKLGKKDQEELTKLQGLTGGAFDKEYVTFMLKDHRMDEKAFKTEMDTTMDPALKAAVMEGESVIHGHLMMIEKIAKDQNIDANGPEQSGMQTRHGAMDPSSSMMNSK